MKPDRLFAIRTQAGKGRHVLHLRLKGGAKGTGRTYVLDTCMNNPRDYRTAVWELATVARERYGIDPSCILNLGPYPVAR